MQTFSPLDIQVRLQLSACAYSTMMGEYINGLKIGKNICHLENKLFLTDVYIKMLSDYIPCVCGKDCTNNCLTEIEAQSIANKLSVLTGVCFKPIGYSYIGMNYIYYKLFQDDDCFLFQDGTPFYFTGPN